ncbi:MAG: NUDIX domain-containing protein [Chloroflexi bacterium]|nr:NUDIX domain-containing protein [Chloroflexota bacterium]
MRWQDQGLGENSPSGERYTVVPRTLVFLVYGTEVLLLRGATNKRLWAGKLNGIGGHIRPEEDVHSAARREVFEETGLLVDDLRLRGVVHIAGQADAPGVLLFVLVGAAPSRQMLPSAEGTLEWHDPRRLPTDVIDDLPNLLPRILAADRAGTIVYGHYKSDIDGRMQFHFDVG